MEVLEFGEPNDKTMREIKFRSFDQGQWSYFLIGQSMTDLQKAIYNDLCVRGIDFFQYTGLKDKVKVELYESDLIVSPWRYGGRPHRIVYSTKFAAFCGSYNGMEYPLTEPEIKDTLKVGNIYENPELLK